MTERLVSVLLVDDDLIDVKAIKRSFAKCEVPCTLHVETDSEKALAFFESEEAAAPAWPHLLIVDLKMPKVSGLELLRRIARRSGRAKPPTFVLSTSGRPAELAEAYASGAVGYVRKSNAGPGFVDFAKLIRSYIEIVEIDDPRPAGAAV